MALLFSDVETRETIRRMKEAAFVFGNNELFGASDTALLAEYVRGLREKESKRKPMEKASPQLKYRRSVIGFLMKVCQYETLSCQTAYLAIYLLDRFMDAHAIVLPQLSVVALVCIVVAGKLLETCHEVPRYKKLMLYIDKGSMDDRRESLIPLERYLLRYFRYDIIVPTEINFLEVFLLYAIDGMTAAEEHLDSNNNNNNNPLFVNANIPEEDQATMEVKMFSAEGVPGTEILKAIQATAGELLQEIILADHESLFAPSLVAASILLAARREHGLNFWTPNLHNVTTYSLEEVQTCLTSHVESNIGAYCLTEPCPTPEFLNVVLDPCVDLDSDDSE